MPTKVILDVDTGTDDAVALMTAALSPDLELVGATTVNGNTTLDYTHGEHAPGLRLDRDARGAGLSAASIGRSPGRRSSAAWPTRIHGDLLDLPPVSTGAAPARPRGRLADRDVPRLGRRHRALSGRAADEHRDGDPEGAADRRRDPGDRDHGRRARPREHRRRPRSSTSGSIPRRPGSSSTAAARSGWSRSTRPTGRSSRPRTPGACAPSARRRARPRPASSCKRIDGYDATQPMPHRPGAAPVHDALAVCAIIDPDDPHDRAHPGRRRGLRRAVPGPDGVRLPLPQRQARERPVRDGRRRAEVHPMLLESSRPGDRPAHSGLTSADGCPRGGVARRSARGTASVDPRLALMAGAGAGGPAYSVPPVGSLPFGQ